MLSFNLHPLGQTLMPLEPVAILVLCVVAGVGTVLLLPSRREASLSKIGGVIVLAAALILAALLVRLSAGDSRRQVGVYFWIFSGIALVAALRVVTHPRPVYSALYFILTVFASAGLFLLLRAEFMAAALVLIYAGAILITYVFVIMLASEASNTGKDALAEHDAVSRDPVIAAAIGFALMGVMLFVIFDKQETLWPNVEPVAPPAIVSGSTQLLGHFLFTKLMIHLELAGLILTVAMVGAIVIARKRIQTDSGEAGLSDEIVLGPATPVNDDPHSLPVQGTMNPRQKEYPEN